MIGWIPPYAIPNSLSAVQSNPLIAKGLTRIALQFWNPSADGTNVVLAPIDATGQKVSTTDIISIRDWAHANGIQVLMTVYNNSQTSHKWDWGLAKNAFGSHRRDFIRALITELETYRFDGIDIDLEGEGFLDQDREAFRLFIRDLSKQLRKRNKLLTIDSFHSPCFNAPNMSWWSDWRAYVDTIHSMGYEDLYEGSDEVFKPNNQKPACANGETLFRYSWQLNFAISRGYHRTQILMGVPTWLAKWGKQGTNGYGDSISDHLKEIKKLQVGIALWDLQLADPNWRSDTTWESIEKLSNFADEK